MRFGEVTQSRNMQSPFLSTATHKLGVACVSGEVLQGEEGLSVTQGQCIMHFFTISCKTGSSLTLGISAVGELYKC